VLAAAFGAVRAVTVRLFQGASGLGSATIVRYLAVTLAVQRFIELLRTQRLDPAASRRIAC
jgi:hypothetical protein